jgi:3-hydroxy-9,10-secoandrosta-1,3,5(10)-triene-9,17-dione monooxygenase reductase component
LTSSPPAQTVAQAVGPDQFRRVLGHFCSGVTIVSTMDGGRPVGFACQAFAALSLDPPLVLFCPATTSSTWQRIAATGFFCANVLADHQREICRTFGRSGPDKFARVAWSPAPSGAPVIDGVLTWADCRVEAVHAAGDHHVVIGRVTALGECAAAGPLLFYRGRYAGVAGGPSADEPPEVVDTLLGWPRHTDWM